MAPRGTHRGHEFPPGLNLGRREEKGAAKSPANSLRVRTDAGVGPTVDA